MTVNLTRIYTKLGDGGETHLGDMSRVAKTHPRIEAYGTVDELNSQIGVTLTIDGLDGTHAAWLRRIQNDLFDVGADLCVPGPPDDGKLRVAAAQVDRLEAEIDRMNADLAPLNSFVLPGGSALAAQLHLARTVTRRAERLVSALTARETVNPAVLKYLNRLSDHLFVLARWVNDRGAGDVLWVPGANR